MWSYPNFPTACSTSSDVLKFCKQKATTSPRHPSVVVISIRKSAGTTRRWLLNIAKTRSTKTPLVRYQGYCCVCNARYRASCEVHFVEMIGCLIEVATQPMVNAFHCLGLSTFAELRKDWLRQKKTIEQLVRPDGEDRQVWLVVWIEVTDPAGKLGKHAQMTLIWIG